jgi:hypothetical protein
VQVVFKKSEAKKPGEADRLERVARVKTTHDSYRLLYSFTGRVCGFNEGKLKKRRVCLIAMTPSTR